MYHKLFHLNAPPFQLTPDPEFLFESRQHSRARAYMESTIWLADGFVVITGEIGAGKTTLIESFLSDLPENVVLAHINQTQLKPVEFLQALLLEFGFREFHDRKVELLATLKEFIINQFTQGKTLLLIVDEAQNLSRKVLEEIRLLSGIEAQNEKPLRIILAGQPELSDKLDSKRLEQLSQRVRLRFHLSTLSKSETKQYIQHRLDVAGAAGRKIFDEDAMDVVFRYAGGVPRLINILCDTAMVCGYSEGKDIIDTELINRAVEELDWSEYETRVSNDISTPSDMNEVENETPNIPLPENRIHSEKPKTAAPARFDVILENHHIMDFPVPIGRTLVGRRKDNDLQLRSQLISRYHLLVTTDDDRSIIEDLNSTNGVFVQSKRIQHHVLADGDVIQLGKHQLVYHDLRSHDANTDETTTDVPALANAMKARPEEATDTEDYDGSETCILE